MAAITITRRRSVLAAAALVVSGCVYLGATAPGLTQVHSAELSSTTPPLGAFVLRIAASDLSLDAAQAQLTETLSHDADVAIRPVDDARIVFVEVLVRAVESGRYDAEAAERAAGALLAATRTAAPRVLDALTKLHAGLDPSQRRLLVLRVSTRFEGWSGSWNGGRPADHAWLADFAEPAFPRGNAMVDDAVSTARGWAAFASAEVGAKCAAPSFDDIARRDLIVRLRK